MRISGLVMLAVFTVALIYLFSLTSTQVVVMFPPVHGKHHVANQYVNPYLYYSSPPAPLSGLRCVGEWVTVRTLTGLSQPRLHRRCSGLGGMPRRMRLKPPTGDSW